jgi:ferrous iron transport protein A
VTLGSPRLEPAQVRRLAELGIRSGAEVMVLHKTVGGGRVLAVGDARIALDRQTLSAIPVLGPA